MTPNDLDALTYLPAIRSRQAELRGYRELRPETKQALVPLVSLGKLGKVDDPLRVLGTVSEAVGGQFFLDLNATPGQTCGGFEDLCDPADAYSAWRRLAASSNNAVPVALLRDSSPERPFIQLVRRIERDNGVVAIRSRRPAQDLNAMQAAMSAVDDVNNMLVILDFSYIRGAMEPKENEALRVITALRTIDPAVRIVSLASSFPKAVSAYGETRGSLDIVERDFHSHIGGEQVAIYGDHASIYPVPFEPSISRWVPRVDYCLDYQWHFERRREDDGGYVECARATVALPDWDPDFAAASWGAGVIAQTAQNGIAPAGFGAPGNWIAARVNMHIERQAALSAGGAGPDDDDYVEY